MTVNAWIFQDQRQKAKLGADECPWSVGWYDPDGKRKSKRIGSKSLAEKFARKVEGQLAAGVYKNDSRKTWVDFDTEYRARIVEAMPPSSRETVELALDNFTAIIKPVKLVGVKTQTIDEFIAERRKAIGRKGQPLSPATINRDLRHLNAALRVAHEWGYLPVVPKVRMVKENQKLPRYVTPEHFAAMYGACDAARFPAALPYSAGDWWRGLLTFAYMTGWRIMECLALRRSDLDLNAATAITRADDNKGGRDEMISLSPVVVDHLRCLVGFHPIVFPWNYARRTLWAEFSRIQTAAGIMLPCDVNSPDHEHTEACHHYGFHDLRRAFATMNAAALSPDELQKLMRHKSYVTTQRYVNMANRMQAAAQKLYVPPVLKAVNG
jgi:integrase